MSNKETYRKLCQEQKNIPIFMQDWWLDIVSKDGSWDVILAEDKNGIVEGICPYFVKKKFGVKIVSMPPLTTFMGPYMLENKKQNPYDRQSHENEIFSQMIDQLPKVKVFRQHLHFDVQNWLPFHWKAFKQSSRYVYILELEDLDAVYQQIHAKVKSKIKQSNFAYGNEISIDQFLDINAMSFQRQNISVPYDKQLVKALVEELIKRKQGKMFCAKDKQGQVASVCLLVWDHRSSYYLIAGDHPDYRDSGAGFSLAWEVIRYSKEKLGLNEFNFDGSMIKEIERVRRRFGAKQQAYHKIYKNSNPIFNVFTD